MAKRQSPMAALVKWKSQCKCPEFNLEFSKEGYISNTVFIENAAEVTNYLKKK
jgi:hypothetical protein